MKIINENTIKKIIMILYIVTEMKKKIYAKNLAKAGHLLTQEFITQP